MDNIDLDAIKEKVNFYELVEFFEEKQIKVTYNNVSLCCPFHSEKTPSFFYNIEKKKAHCYSCRWDGDVFNYIMQKQEYKSFRESIDFLLGFTGIDPKLIEKVGVKKEDYGKSLRILKKYGVAAKENKFTYFNELDIKALVDNRGDFFIDRGFSKETLDFFEVGFDPKEKRVIVPIRDENKQLVGATGRTIYKDFKEKKIPKWKHYKNSNISENFFNINNGIYFTKESKGGIIYVVEGPSDVMALHQNGFKNTIACLNNGITQKQKIILLRNFLSIYLMLDGDMGGETGKSYIYNQLKGYFNLYDVRVPQGKDPDQLSKEEIQECINNAKKL